jgi:uncharacterized protein DUF5990
MEREIPVRITLIGPPPGVLFCLQRGRAELVSPALAADPELSFDLFLRVGRRPDGQPNFLGPFAQGRPADRFVYVRSGTLAGQADSCWTRRARVPLARIDWALLDEIWARPGAVLEARIPGRAKDGGPVCATVRLSDGWRVTQRQPTLDAGAA